MQKGHHTWMLKPNPGYSGVVEGTMHRCLSAERSSCLNVETESSRYSGLSGRDPQIDKIGNIGIGSFTMWNKKIQPLRIDQGSSAILVWCSLFWANLASVCNSETLSFLYSHALLILTKSSKSKNQVVHEQKFKDPLNSICHFS